MATSSRPAPSRKPSSTWGRRAGRRHRPGRRAGPLLVSRRPRSPTDRRWGWGRPVSAARDRAEDRANLASAGLRGVRRAGRRSRREAGPWPLALAGFHRGDGREARPTAPRFQEAPDGRGGPPTARAPPAPQDRTALTCPAVTFSNENALSCFRVSPYPHPPPWGPPRAALVPPAAGDDGASAGMHQTRPRL
jgi:hypothetical protein